MSKFVLHKGKSAQKDAAYCNWFDLSDRLMICNENYKSRDKKFGDKMVWPSEVLWQSWKSMALEGGKLGTGSVRVMRDCLSDSNQRTIKSCDLASFDAASFRRLSFLGQEAKDGSSRI